MSREVDNKKNNNDRDEVNSKITMIDEVNKELELLKDNYNSISDTLKKIEDISSKNSSVSSEISDLTSSIKKYDAKYDGK